MLKGNHNSLTAFLYYSLYLISPFYLLSHVHHSSIPLYEYRISFCDVSWFFVHMITLFMMRRYWTTLSCYPTNWEWVSIPISVNSYLFITIVYCYNRLELHEWRNLTLKSHFQGLLWTASEEDSESQGTLFAECIGKRWWNMGLNILERSSSGHLNCEAPQECRTAPSIPYQILQKFCSCLSRA